MRTQLVLPAGTWDEAQEIDRVLLDYDHRHRRRLMLSTERRQNLLLDLPQPTHLHQDDGLLLDEGGVVRVSARAEPLMEISAAPAALMRIAWHLGNRHLSVQLFDERLRIRTDPVIADMVRHLGGHVQPIEAPFDPETGAYAGGHHHSGHG